MKKLLLLGSQSGTVDLVLKAREMGLYVIVTDRETTFISEAKQLADEAWNISVQDTKQLAQKCFTENIDGCFTGANNMTPLYVRKLCKEVGLPMYCNNDSAYEAGWNKRFFKEVCKNIGAPTAKDYRIEKIMSCNKGYDTIDYPVVVKPLDRAGNFGISFVSEKSQLNNAIEEALSGSQKKDVIIERMLKGREFEAKYVIAEGEARFCYLLSYYMADDSPENWYTCLITSPFYEKKYIDELDTYVKQIFKNIGTEDGTAWVEVMLDEKDNQFYLIEMGYRFCGHMTETLWEKVSGFDVLKYCIEAQIGIKHKICDLPMVRTGPYATRVASVSIFINKDATIERIEGIDKLHAQYDDILIDFHVREGSRRKKGSQVAKLKFLAKSSTDVADKLEAINNCIKIYDENNEDIATRFSAFDKIERDYQEGIKQWNDL